MQAHTRRRALKEGLLLSLVWLCLFSSTQAGSHPIEYHMQPLSAGQVERVVSSLEKIASRLQDPGAVQLPDDAMGISLALWSLWDALDAGGGPGEDPLPDILVAAGYESSYFMIEEWEIEAQRVLETYEVLHKGLGSQAVQRAYSKLEALRPQLDEQQLLARERAVIRDQQLVNRSAIDLALVANYQARIDRLFAKLQLDPRR